MIDFSLITFVAVFLFVALASRQLGGLARRVTLPLITGYLIAGLVAGPYVLGLISNSAVENLKFVEEISLAVIAFAAGSELYWKEMRSSLRSLAWNIVAQIVITFILGAVAVYLLAEYLPFSAGLGRSGQIAVALLAATILIARSPSSVIAMITELRAKGPFTKTALGVTVIKDVIVILLFALNVQIAAAIFESSDLNLRFVLVLLLALGSSFVLSVIVTQLFRLILGTRMHPWLHAGLILLIGYGVFVLSGLVQAYSHDYLLFEIHLEPLLICMLASFLMINRTKYRRQFTELVHEISPLIYIAFFTLTGATVRLDVLATLWPIALILFGVRIVALFIAGLVGGTAAGDPMKHRMVSWMAFITQAGVGIGLAQEVAFEFPELGSTFATTMLSVIALSQLVGDPLLKFAIRFVGESRERGAAAPDANRDALILGIEGQSLALARRLRTHHWQITVADVKSNRVEPLAPEDFREILLPAITAESLGGHMNASTDALIAMLDDDDANYRACEAAYEIGVERIIVRLNDIARRAAFEELGAWVVNPTTAIVGLLEHFVRAPDSAAQLIYGDSKHATAQITVTDREMTGIPLQDLRMPNDVLFLTIYRNQQSIVPHGNTVLHLNDHVTVMGSEESLDEVTLKLGY